MSDKLKIGLIVDGEHVSRYVCQLADWARTTDALCISHLIVQERPTAKKGRGSFLSRLFGKSPLKHAAVALWKAKTRLELRRLAAVEAYRGFQETTDMGARVPGRIRVTPLVSKSGFVHRFSDQDLEKVRRENFDLLIRCGSGILRGAILTSARLGILSFHHGDNRINRGGPAGFWEVYHRQDRTGFVVQRLTEELDGGEVILRGYIPTQDAHLLNAAMLFARSYYHLRALLLRIARTGELPAAEPHYPYSGKLFVTPKLHEMAIYMLRRFTRSAATRVRRTLGHQERWGIAFAKCDWRSAVLWRGTRIETPPGRFLADPFVVTREGRSCVFAEDYVYRASRGHISAFELTDGTARELGVAVKEDFHLSFPFLFEFDGALYMCPETCDAKEIRIYRCTQFPLKWQLASVAMKDVVAADTMFFFQDGLWWMLTNISCTEPHNCASELHLFWSTTPLTADWQPHPRNPVLFDPQNARNGGLLKDGDGFIRVAQQQRFGSYGASARLFRITRISTDEYAEEAVSSITPDFAPGIHGVHHLHSNGVYSVWDYKKWQRP